MNTEWEMDGGIVKITKECGCEAVVDKVTTLCAEHDFHDLERYSEWRTKVLDEAKEAQDRRNEKAKRDSFFKLLLQPSDPDQSS